METNNPSSFEGCYGVKPDSVGDSWMCSRCAQGAWVVVSKSHIHIFWVNNFVLQVSLNTEYTF